MTLEKKKKMKRLQKELKRLEQQLPDCIAAVKQDPSNRLVIHFVIDGARDTAYEGGLYWGALRLAPEYPNKPPSIVLFTPSGRFKTNTKICTSTSDFHPERWSAALGCESVLVGLVSFMSQEARGEGYGVGGINASSATRRRLASSSVEWNVRNREFRSLFPELRSLTKRRMRRQAASALAQPAAAQGASMGLLLAAMFVVLLVCVSALLYIKLY